MKLDLLVLAAHPDDAELGCGGTILKHIAAGQKVGIVDFTKGELGTRGTIEMREQEANASAKILGLSVRENLNFRDGFYVNDEPHQREVIRAIRKYQPEIVLANAIYDRHPDHGRGGELAFQSCYLSRPTHAQHSDGGIALPPWRPKILCHSIQSQFITFFFVVDVSDFWEEKMKSVSAFKSQFYDPDSKEPETYISSQGFLKMLEARGTELGHAIGAQYGEGFTVRRTIGVNILSDIR
ncbi:bacillithiol biosynthesis deacetylase BshB1 [Flammeovirgaceae bacterium]